MMKLMIMMIMLMIQSLLMKKKLVNIYLYNMILLVMMMFLMSMNYSNLWMMIYNNLGTDSFSTCMVIISMWILMMMFLISNKINNNNYFAFLLMLLLFVLMMSFMMMNYFLFYLFFEISLIPTFLLILGWGYQPERVNASMYMMMYTMFASLPLLILMFYLYNINNTLNFWFLTMLKFKENESFMYLFMLLAFLIKLPMFLFHMWLPKAHVEAPVSGSMILAGVMLKLGGYGIFRSMNMMMKISQKYNIYILLISLMGMLILSGVCLRQYDMKLLVAYSSVVHMSMMLMSLMCMTYWSSMGSLMMMIGHGFCSPAMFMLVNYFYERTNSRSILINKGLIYFFPSMMLWWFLFCMSNLSAPISLNLLSELMMISPLMNWSIYIMLILMIAMFLSACYSLYLFVIVHHGQNNSLNLMMYPMNEQEYLMMLMLWIPLNFFILKLDFFM